jgi:hypothetical protein
LTRLTTARKTLDPMGKQVKSKTPAIRKDTRDRDIDRKQLTQTDQHNESGRVEDDDGGMEGGRRKREEVSKCKCNKCVVGGRRGRDHWSLEVNLDLLVPCSEHGRYR